MFHHFIAVDEQTQIDRDVNCAQMNTTGNIFISIKPDAKRLDQLDWVFQSRAFVKSFNRANYSVERFVDCQSADIENIGIIFSAKPDSQSFDLHACTQSTASS